MICSEVLKYYKLFIFIVTTQKSPVWVSVAFYLRKLSNSATWFLVSGVISDISGTVYYVNNEETD